MALFTGNFNLATVAGVGMSMATVVASVGMGFAYGRRLNINERPRAEDSPLTHSVSCTSPATSPPSTPQQPTSSEAEQANSEPTTSDRMASPSESLKRKTMHDHDENNNSLGYPYNLQALYPNKRSRTPPRQDDTGKADEQAVPDETRRDFEPKNDEPLLINEPAKTTCNTSHQMKSLRSTTCSGFASYSGGSVSSFKSASLKSASNFPPPSSSTMTSSGSSVSWLQDITAETAKPATSWLLEPSPSVKPPVSASTGEEHEDIELELKGVKLYIKRGSREFGGGMLGHAKVLANRESLQERILFRREPLWQVTMNARLTPFTKCTYNEEEGVLRVAVVEALDGVKDVGKTPFSGAKSQEVQKADDKEKEKEVVVYALKPGRFCSKTDFKDFAVSLLGSSGLQAKPDTQDAPQTADEDRGDADASAESAST